MSTLSSRSCIHFSIKEIKEATNQFDRAKILGQGGEATVYLAEISIDSKKTPVAIKLLKESSKEFETEIHALSKIQHPYIVSLLGYCNESDHKILVFEYMENGCLSDYLKKGNGDISLSWLQRLNICLGAARGLQHLHKETDEFPKGIIHRDVKPGNILVGENWMIGKVSDFGMFKLSSVGQDKSLMTTNLKGTSGYYAPEYIKHGRITRKIDVYAFGVVLFEVLCRKMPWDRDDESYYADDKEDLGLWAYQNVDTEIKGEISEDSLMIFTEIIGRSLQEDPGRRPTMDHVVLDLEKVLEWQESKTQRNQRFHPRCRQFSIEQIIAATNQFDSSKIIRTGDDGNVYLAEIYTGLKKTQVAVKQLKDSCNDFESMIQTLCNIQHPNIVSLIGYSYESGHQILVYEYMTNGPLDDYYRGTSRISLSVQQQLNICLGAAQGLQFLHSETDEFPNGITYGDMTASDILVGENWVGKLPEIGMINLSDARQEKSVTDTTSARNRDVYAFGMALFGVLSMDLNKIKEEMSMDSFKLGTSILSKILQGNEQPTMNDVVLDIEKLLECLNSE